MRLSFALSKARTCRSSSFHDVTLTAIKCTRSMYVVENGRKKLALLQRTCARGNTLRECK